MLCLTVAEQWPLQAVIADHIPSLFFKIDGSQSYDQKVMVKDVTFS